MCPQYNAQVPACTQATHSTAGTTTTLLKRLNCHDDPPNSCPHHTASMRSAHHQCPLPTSSLCTSVVGCILRMLDCGRAAVPPRATTRRIVCCVAGVSKVLPPTPAGCCSLLLPACRSSQPPASPAAAAEAAAGASGVLATGLMGLSGCREQRQQQQQVAQQVRENKSTAT